MVTTGDSRTWVASLDGRLWRDTAGHPGLAASGSGGQGRFIAALYRRTEDAAGAAVRGGRLHAPAGERLGERFGAVGCLAREVASEVPAVLSRLEN